MVLIAGSQVLLSSPWISALEHMREAGIQENWAAFALARCRGDTALAVDFVFTSDMAALVAKDGATEDDETCSSTERSAEFAEEPSPSPISRAAAFSGVAAADVDSDVLAALPPEVAEEVKRQMALEQRARKKPSSGSFPPRPQSASTARGKKSTKEHTHPGTQGLSNFFQVRPVAK